MKKDTLEEIPPTKDTLVKPMEPQAEKRMKKLSTEVIVAVYVILILLGVGTGYLLTRSVVASSPSVVKTETTTGSTDTKTFKDSAVGTLEKGGLNGEGTHKLIREGGPSQTAYLISSVVDLDEFIGKKVKVWGQTIAAKKVSWLMDVGKVELQ